MAFPTPIPNPNPYKITQIFNQNRWGWTETYYANLAGASTDPYGDINDAMANLNFARRQTMCSVNTLEGMRVAQILPPARAYPTAAPSFSMGLGTVQPPPSGLVDGWLFVMRNVDGQITDKHFYRGWAAVDVPWSGNGAFPASVPTRVNNWKTFLEPFLSSSVIGPFGGTVSWCIRARNRDDTVNKIFDIPTIATDIRGNLIFTVKTLDLGILVPGDKIAVVVPRSKCVRGVNGYHRVTAVTVDGANTLIDTATKFCCNSADLVGLAGKGQILVYSYYQIKGVGIRRVLKRDTGKAFFVGRGKSSKTCCAR